MHQGHYADAYAAFNNAMKYYPSLQVYINRAELTSAYGNPSANQQYLIGALRKFPNNSTLWFYLALLEYRGNDSKLARFAIEQAHLDDPTNSVTTSLYEQIMQN
jgi:tetratricopeptide (TPR) repeat protein